MGFSNLKLFINTAGGNYLFIHSKFLSTILNDMRQHKPCTSPKWTLPYIFSWCNDPIARIQHNTDEWTVYTLPFRLGSMPRREKTATASTGACHRWLQHWPVPQQKRSESNSLFFSITSVGQTTGVIYIFLLHSIQDMFI